MLKNGFAWLVSWWYNGITTFYHLLGHDMAMVKKLSRHGNSLALVIDRSILEPSIHIDEDTSLDFDRRESLVVSPVRDNRRRKRFEDRARIQQ